MRSKYLYIITLLLLVFAACSENEIATFDGKDGVYFNQRERVGNILIDSTNFTFVYVEEDVGSATVTIPVQLVGREMDVARPVNIKVVGGSAVEGTDFELPDNPVLPAGESSFLYEVTLLRSASLQEEAKTIELVLEENEYFEKIITHEVVNTQSGEKVTALKHKIEFSEMFVRGAAPAAWITQMYAFSPERFFLVTKVMEVPRSDFNDPSKISGARFQYLISETIKYVQEQLMLENPDPDIYDSEGELIF